MAKRISKPSTTPAAIDASAPIVDPPALPNEPKTFEAWLPLVESAVYDAMGDAAQIAAETNCQATIRGALAALKDPTDKKAWSRLSEFCAVGALRKSCGYDRAQALVAIGKKKHVTLPNAKHDYALEQTFAEYRAINNGRAQLSKSAAKLNMPNPNATKRGPKAVKPEKPSAIAAGSSAPADSFIVPSSFDMAFIHKVDAKLTAIQHVLQGDNSASYRDARTIIRDACAAFSKAVATAQKLIDEPAAPKAALKVDPAMWEAFQAFMSTQAAK